ncbi:MAG: CoA-binding protein [Pirellulales bacterium]
MPNDEQAKIREFLAGTRFAVVGASQDRSKYGNKVLRCYLQNNLDAIPVNPTASEVEGVKAYPSLGDVPGDLDGVSIITPPAVTERAVAEAIARGIKSVWMQPGAESSSAVAAAEGAGMNVVACGPCILVALRYRERD